MIFKDISNPEKGNQKISVIEKLFIFSCIALVKVIIWKVKKAKTYGDLMKLSYFIESKLDSMDTGNSFEEDHQTTESVVKTIKEIKKTKQEIKNL